jgi:hypothetical protein
MWPLQDELCNFIWIMLIILFMKFWRKMPLQGDDDGKLAAAPPYDSGLLNLQYEKRQPHKHTKPRVNPDT